MLTIASIIEGGGGIRREPMNFKNCIHAHDYKYYISANVRLLIKWCKFTIKFRNLVEKYYVGKLSL